MSSGYFISHCPTFNFNQRVEFSPRNGCSSMGRESTMTLKTWWITLFHPSSGDLFELEELFKQIKFILFEMKIHNKSPLRCLSIITIRLFWFMFKQRKENTWKSDRSAFMWAWRNEKWEKMRVKSRVKTRVTHFSRENLTLHKHHHGLSPNTDSFSVLVSSSCSHNYSNYTIPLSLSPLHDRCIFQTFCSSAPIVSSSRFSSLLLPPHTSGGKFF